MPSYAFQLPDQIEPMVMELPNDEIARHAVIDAFGELVRTLDWEMATGVVLELRVKDGQGRHGGALRITAARSG